MKEKSTHVEKMTVMMMMMAFVRNLDVRRGKLKLKNM